MALCDRRRWLLSLLVSAFVAGCNCGGNPPSTLNVVPVPTGTNSVSCQCVLAGGACGLNCCDPGTGPNADAGCTNMACAPFACCAPGTGGPGQPACNAAGCNGAVGGCCDTGTGAMGQPMCAHSTCNVSGNCSAIALSVCIPPNTGNINAFCNTTCQNNARS